VAGDEVIPAAGDVSFGIEAEDVGGDGIAMVVVVEEPAVERGGAKSGLDGVEVHEGIGSSQLSAFSSQLVLGGVRSFRPCQENKDVATLFLRDGDGDFAAGVALRRCSGMARGCDLRCRASRTGLEFGRSA